MERHFCAAAGCGKSFNRAAKLVEHMRRHTGERPFACTQCPSAFAQAKHLRVHLLSHQPVEERAFVCAECDKRFTLPHHLGAHQRSHVARQVRGEMTCPLCGRNFTHPKRLTTHIALHRTCRCCGKICLNETRLAIHMQRRHEENYSCSHCGRAFAVLQELQRHMRDVHTTIRRVPPSVALISGLAYERRQFVCPEQCGRRFTRQYDLERHLQSSDHAQGADETSEAHGHLESPET